MREARLFLQLGVHIPAQLHRLEFCCHYSYLDDMEAGWLIEDNLFESIHDCMFIGGGRQNTVRGNLFINCTVPVHVDDRGLTWMRCKELALRFRHQHNLCKWPSACHCNVVRSCDSYAGSSVGYGAL